PGHGRSPHHPDVLGPMAPQMSAEFLRPIFVPPPEGPDSNPVAHLHTQWPGGRGPGDPLYDHWLCNGRPMLADLAPKPELAGVRGGGARPLGEGRGVRGPAVAVATSGGGRGVLAAADAEPPRAAALSATAVLGPPSVRRRGRGPGPGGGVAASPLPYDPPV